MFLPQVVTAITGSVLGGRLAQQFGTKRVYLAGLLAGLASMALLIISQFFTSSQPLAYGLLLAATACLGAGFGLTVPAINALTAALHSERADASVLVLKALRRRVSKSDFEPPPVPGAQPQRPGAAAQRAREHVNIRMA